MELLDKADAVVIGGGCIGLSIAYHLAKKGCSNVVLCERGLVGSGSTSKAAGGIRQQFSTEINIRLSQISVEFFQHFEEELGCSAEFRQVGYLFLASTHDEMALFEKNIALQRRLGVPVRTVLPDDIRQIVPQLYLKDILGGTYCPVDGYAGVHEVTQGLARGARRLGAKLYEDTEVTGLRVEGGRIVEVLTNRGRIATPNAIVAAGAFSSQVAATIGVDLPIKPYRRHIFVTGPVPEISPNIPLTIEFASGFYFRKDGEPLLMGMANKAEPSTFTATVDWDFLPQVVERAIHRVPVLAKAGIQQGWAGLYEVTPDHHPILGAIPQVDGFYCAAGFSGHGFMHSPAAGRLIAELIINGKPFLDITPLTITRFATGQLIDEANVV